MIKSKRLDFCSIILLETTEPFNSKQAEWVIEPISKTAKTPFKEISSTNDNGEHFNGASTDTH